MRPHPEKRGSVAIAMALAAGLNAASCERPRPDAEHPALTQQELQERYSNPQWDFPQIIRENDWMYLNVGPGKFLRIPYSEGASSYFDDLFEKRSKALSKASSDSERQQLRAFYSEKIRQDFCGPNCVRVE